MVVTLDVLQGQILICVHLIDKVQKQRKTMQYLRTISYLVIET